MSLEVKLQVFEGPLDLLLHLIDKDKIDIYDIPIVSITQQYLDYINQCSRHNQKRTGYFHIIFLHLINII